MKCPKCNYISFDFYQSCQKCKRDLVQAKAKMNFPEFMSSPPANLSFMIAAIPTEPEKTESMANFDTDETVAMNSPTETEVTSEASTLQTEDEIEDTLNFDDEDDDLNFDDISLDDEPSTTPPMSTISASDTMDSDIDFSFENDSEEITLDMDGPAQDTAAPSQLDDDDTTDGDIDFDFNMDLLGDDQTTLNASEDEITTASFEKGNININKDNVTMELEESVTALVDSIEVSEETSSNQNDENGTNTPELENLDLDLDLDKISDK